MIIIAIDPGEKTGWARFEAEDKPPVSVGEIPFNELYTWLTDQNDPEIIWVVEDYRIRPGNLQRGYSHEWSKAITPRVIGAFEFHAFLCGQEFHLQQPSIKAMGYRYLGYDGKSKSLPLNHAMDACAHGAYYLRKKRNESSKNS